MVGRKILHIDDARLEKSGLRHICPVASLKTLCVYLRALRLAPPTRSHILTNYLSRVEEGEEVVAELRALARERGAAFVPVWLECPLPELEARMGQPERRERLKLRDPLILRGLMERGGVMDAPADALVLDTACLDPHEAARRIVAFAGAVSGSA